MSEIVNLRLARKAKHRAEAETVAAANRLRFGRSRDRRRGDALESDRAARVLDGARLLGDADPRDADPRDAGPRDGPDA